MSEPISLALDLRVICSELTRINGGFNMIFHIALYEMSSFQRFHTMTVQISGGAVAQSVERATPGQEVPGSIPAVAARSLLVGSVSV